MALYPDSKDQIPYSAATFRPASFAAAGAGISAIG
jgi:hypothetical protein